MNFRCSKQVTPVPGARHTISLGFVFLPFLLAATCLRSQEPAAPPPAIPAQASYVVAHVDVVPTAADAALPPLNAYAATCCQAPGAWRFEVLREAGRPNHFTLVEVWESGAARQTNETTAATRRFREQL